MLNHHATHIVAETELQIDNTNSNIAAALSRLAVVQSLDQ
jgi:hypothetical protein